MENYKYARKKSQNIATECRVWNNISQKKVTEALNSKFSLDKCISVKKKICMCRE